MTGPARRVYSLDEVAAIVGRSTKTLRTARRADRHAVRARRRGPAADRAPARPAAPGDRPDGSSPMRITVRPTPPTLPAPLAIQAAVARLLRRGVLTQDAATDQIEGRVR